MAIHAAAFGLFIVSVVLFTAFYLNYFVSFLTTQNGGTMLANFEETIALGFMFVCSFISQCLLCVIFWNLATPVEAKEETEAIEDSEAPNIVEIEV